MAAGLLALPRDVTRVGAVSGQGFVSTFLEFLSLGLVGAP